MPDFEEIFFKFLIYVCLPVQILVGAIFVGILVLGAIAFLSGESKPQECLEQTTDIVLMPAYIGKDLYMLPQTVTNCKRYAPEAQQ